MSNPANDLEWVKAVLPTVGVIGTVFVGHLIWHWQSAKKADLDKTLERHKAELNGSVTSLLEVDRASRNESLERLRRDLSETLAQRTRRAEFLRLQISNLYGPLLFWVESSSQFLAINSQVMKAFPEFCRKFIRPGEEIDKDGEAHGMIETANRYIMPVIENNKMAINVLKEAWGWLDYDDHDLVREFMVDVARHKVEFEDGHKLPLPLYVQTAMDAAVGAPHFLREAFVNRLREKLHAKQRELAGLTGAGTAPPNA